MGYMINRIKNLFGSDTNVYKKLSPINVVTTREDNDRNVHVDIAGITLIDYLTAYKWYSRENPESYTLEYISNLELGTGKLQYKGSLHELYENDYNKMVDYNIIDTKRVKQLEEKLSFIKLIQTIGLMSNCPMKHYIAMTNVIEGKMLTYFRRNNLCAPKFEGGREQQPYEGAYVKDPHKGLHRWIASIDIASSYPSHIITLNMSVESYVGRIISFTEDDVVRYTSKKEFPEFEMFRFNTKKTDKFDDNKLKRFNLMLQKGLIAIAPCGTCFKTKPEGVMAHVERDMFFYRKSIKKKMKEETDKNKLKQLDLSQLAQKVALNSFYGLTATIYTRYHNSDISKAITSCARHTIKQGEKFGNELLNNPNDKLKSILKELS
jgi:DNA polymerase elongation subunit (family B)